MKIAMTAPANDNDDRQTLQGHVRFFNEARGFGFVAPDNGGADVFIHVSGFAKKTGDDFNPEGARVEFEIGTNQRTGRPCATNARLVE